MTLSIPTEDLRAAQTIWDFMRMHQPLEKADVMIVLGSIDLRVADYAAELWKRGLAPCVVTSGGIAHADDLLRTTWQTPEADVFAERMIVCGVPNDIILREREAQHTGENATRSAALLAAAQLRPQSVLVVTKPYMERRAYATFKKQWPDARALIMVASPPISFDDYFTEEQPFEKVLTIMLGDFDRIEKYAALGFQIPQEIPLAVHKAYHELIARGFGGHATKDKEGRVV